MSKIFIVIQLLFVVLIISCKEESIPVIEDVGTSSVSGTVMFLDYSIAPYAKIQLYSSTVGRSIYDTCDADGKFSFDGLYDGEYTLIFNSTNYDLNSSYVKFSVSGEQTLTENIYITYNMLDEFSARQINDQLFLIMLQPAGAKIDGRYDLVDYLSGSYKESDTTSNVSLSADVYKIPEGLNWNNINFTPDSIPDGFEFLFEIEEQQTANKSHEMRITGDNIETIFSDPPNGFAFIAKKDTVEKVIKIPCVDGSNNDFGFKIVYK